MKTAISLGNLRPDARDLTNNSGNTLLQPYKPPYPWVDPPYGAILINRRATIPAPANGTQALITSFQCPQAMEGVILFCMNVFSGADAQGNAGSGNVTWSIDVNIPLNATNSVGYAPPDFATITNQLGSFANGPWPIPGGIFIRDSDTIRYKVKTTAPVGVGAPNFVTGMLLGYYWPMYLRGK